MREFGELVKLLFRNTYRRNAGSKRDRKSALIVGLIVAAILIPVLAGTSVMITYLSKLFTEAGKSYEVLSLLLSVSQMFIIVFGVQSVVSYMYLSADNEFLQQLPVKPDVIFVAKMVFVYLNELIMTVIMVVPFSAAFVAGVKFGGGSLPAIFYIGMPFAILLSPTIPLIVVTVLSFLLAKILKYLRGRQTLTLAVCLALMLAFLACYMSVMPDINGVLEKEGDEFMSAYMGVVEKISSVFFYNKLLAKALTGAGFFSNAGLYLLILAGAAGLMIWLSYVLYNKAVSEQMERVTVRLAKERPLRDMSVKKSLLLRETKLLMGDLAFALNTVMSVLMPPFMLMITSAMGGDFTVIASEQDLTLSPAGVRLVSSGMVTVFGMLMLCGMDYAATVAVTREGKTFYINKYLPVTAKQIIDAKYTFANIFTAFGAVLVSVFGLFFNKTGALNALLTAVTLFIFGTGFNSLGIYRDLKKPNLGWNNANEAIKKNFYPLIPMFYCIAIAAGMIMILSVSLTYFDSVWAYVALWGASVAGGTVFSLVNRNRLYTRGIRLLENLEG